MTRNISPFQNKFSGENLFFTSDTHFFHEGIIKFCNHPFESVEEMNETLIRNWNETVPEGGMHWLIGAIDSIPLHSIWVETGALQDNNPVYFKDPIYSGWRRPYSPVQGLARTAAQGTPGQAGSFFTEVSPLVFPPFPSAHHRFAQP